MYENINLRGITELEVKDLAQVNLIVGNNACGKTTFLEGIFFLVGAMNPKLPLSANNLRNLNILSNKIWDTYFHNLDANIPIIIEGQVSISKENERLEIHPRKRERKESSKKPPTNTTIMSIESATYDNINGLNLEFTTSKRSKEINTTSVFLEGEEFVTEGLKNRDIRGTFCGPYPNTDLAPRFAEVQRTKRIEEAISLLKQIEPKISDLRLNEISLLEADIGLPHLIPANLMGGGFAKLLSVALAMLENQHGIVLIDEIENGLHHSVQQKLWDAVFKWANTLDVQVFATSHSTECIRAFNETIKMSLLKSQAKFFRIERKGDIFQSVEYTSELLNESLESDWEIR